MDTRTVTVTRVWCSECAGTGHAPDCTCEGSPTFGCCEWCGGDGRVRVTEALPCEPEMAARG